jgi:tetratricopeptide (TPR) repeat protein
LAAAASQWPAALVCLAAIAVYALSVRNGFAYDDVPLILLDPRVHSLGDLPAILAQPYWPVAGQELAIWRPLTTLSFAIDWALSGGAAAWFHLVNVLWHVAACILVLRLLRELFAPPAALAGALLFAVHPVHVEAVANVVGRGDVMAAVFALAACLLWIRRPDQETRPAARTVIAASALFALALFAKESAVMLPALLLLLDAARGRWRLSGATIRPYARAVAPAFAALALVLAGYLGLRAAVLDSFAPARVHPAADVLGSRWHLILTSLQAWPHYLRLLLFPRTLLIDYGPRIIMPATTWTSSAVLGLTILVGLVLGGVLALARGRGRTALGLLWLPVAILPLSNLLFTTGVLVAERTLYLPSFAAAVGFAGASGAMALLASAHRRRALQAFAAAAIALLAGRTVIRVPEWESTERIFASLARDRPDSFRAHWILGRAARQEGDREAAGRHYAEALRLWPYRQGMLAEVAAFAVQEGHATQALEIAAFAARHWPASVDAQRLLAAVAFDLGDTAAARAAIDAGLRLAPGDSLLHRLRLSLPDTASARREPLDSKEP